MFIKKQIYYYYHYFDGKSTTISLHGKCGGIFVQLLVPNNQSQNTTAGQCKVNNSQSKMVPFLRLKNTCMAYQYASQ